jgi:IMP dehydrogenase
LPIDFYSKLVKASEAYTFRDFVLLPGRSEVEPDKVDLSVRLTKSIKLNLPFISSPMDTVTESEMAIALARQGGLGIIHRNMSIEEQVENAKKVKRAESFVIRDVFTIGPHDKISDALELMNKHSISGLPVVESDHLVGILTRRDVNFADRTEEVRAVMTSDVVVAQPDVSIEDAKRIMHKHRVEKLPVVGNDKKLLGLITIKDVYSRERFPFAARDSQGRLLVGAAVSPFDLDRAKTIEKYVDLLVSDVAHFHNSNVLEAAKKVVKETSVDFVAGNLGTLEGTRDTIEALDGRLSAIRAGVGSGSICVTSEVTKAGAPTLFAVTQIALGLQEAGMESIPIIADGGIRSAGDAALALAAGASAVMMGNVFAGCTESPGGLIKVGGKYYKPYRGMGSDASRQKRFAMDRYNQPSKGIAEGVEGVVPYRGDVQVVVEEFASGLKASFGYAGASSIKELWLKARFGTVSAAGSEELRPHSIILPGEEKI